MWAASQAVSFRPGLGLGEAGAAGFQTRAAGKGARGGWGPWFMGKSISLWGKGDPSEEGSVPSIIQEGWVPLSLSHTHTSVITTTTNPNLTWGLHQC